MMVLETPRSQIMPLLEMPCVCADITRLVFVARRRPAEREKMLMTIFRVIQTLIQVSGKQKWQDIWSI
jgi:hypothetical protein